MSLQSALAQFTGTESYHVNPMYRWLKYTDGVYYFVNNAGGGAYWFLDIIGTELRGMAQFRSFLSITLDVDANQKAVIKVTDGDDEQLWSRTIDWTDCPTGEYRFFVTSDVMMLASEY